ncbi:MAG: hypothetical protein R2932_33795 [Caldilineaceae bacterium]
MEAWRILTEPSYRPIFLTGNFGVPPLNAYANALTFGIWQAWGRPVGPTAMRVTAALLGTLTVLGLYALAGELRRQGREWGAPSAAFPLLAAAILAGMRWHIHFSRMGIEPIFVPLVWTLATGLLLYGWRTGNRPAFVGSGVVLAAGMYAYQGAWVIPFCSWPQRYFCSSTSGGTPCPIRQPGDNAGAACSSRASWLRCSLRRWPGSLHRTWS